MLSHLKAMRRKDHAMRRSLLRGRAMSVVSIIFFESEIELQFICVPAVELLKRGACMKPGSQLCKVTELFTTAHLLMTVLQQKLQQIKDKVAGVSQSYRCQLFSMKLTWPTIDFFQTRLCKSPSKR
jgi:hypothetical protein